MLTTFLVAIVTFLTGAAVGAYLFYRLTGALLKSKIRRWSLLGDELCSRIANEFGLDYGKLIDLEFEVMKKTTRELDRRHKKREKTLDEMGAALDRDDLDELERVGKKIDIKLPADATSDLEAREALVYVLCNRIAKRFKVSPLELLVEGLAVLTVDESELKKKGPEIKRSYYAQLDDIERKARELAAAREKENGAPARFTLEKSEGK